MRANTDWLQQERGRFGADFKGLRRLREHCGLTFTSGIVLYDGTAAVPFGDDLWAVPLGWLALKAPIMPPYKLAKHGVQLHNCTHD